MTQQTDAPARIGYCPYCGVTLRTHRSSEHPSHTQVTCGTKCGVNNVLVPDADRDKWGLRVAWEVAAKLRSRWSV